MRQVLGILAVMAASLTPAAGQDQLWIRQFGTSAHDYARALCPAGGAFAAGRTLGSLGGPAAGGSDAWLTRFGTLCPADLTTTAVPGSPGYGVPNGILNNDDFFYYLAIFAAGC